MTKTDEELILERLRELAEEPVPPAALQRWRQALDAAARPAQRRPIAPGLRFAAAALGLAAGIGAAFLAVREKGGVPGPEGPVESAIAVALKKETDRRVREQAIFALSQLPGEAARERWPRSPATHRSRGRIASTPFSGWDSRTRPSPRPTWTVCSVESEVPGL